MVLLAALGFFIFTTRTIPYQSLDRSQAWRHPNQSVVGAPPPSQFTGADPEEITISGELRPEVTGGTGSIDFLRQMADTGAPYPLIMGSGRIMGSYVITSISEKGSEMNHDGTPRAISFSMGLKKVSETAVGLEDRALLLAVGAVRKLTGI